MTTAIGLVAWLAGMLLVPGPLAARILLLAPLVVVPQMLGSLPPRRWVPSLSGWPALLVGLPLLIALALPAGTTAMVFTLPWLALAVVCGFSALLHGLARLPGILYPQRAVDLGVDASLGFLAVAAVFMSLDRLGVQPMGFSAAIILLTAIHFHFAGFGLLAIAALAATKEPKLRAAVLGLVVGIPLTAVAFIASSDALNAIGAVLVGLSGIGIGVTLIASHLRGRAGWAQRIAGVALLIGMPLGIAWSLAILLGIEFIDVEAMVRTHGALNATAVLLAAVTIGRCE